MGFATQVGRVLIVIAIASSSFSHLSMPDRSLVEFKENYATLDKVSQQYLNYDIPLDNVYVHVVRPTGPWQLRSSGLSSAW